MSNGALSTEAMESLKELMKNMLVEMFPEVLKQFAPVMGNVYKEMIPVIVEATKDFCKQQTQAFLRRDDDTNTRNTQIFNDFKNRHTKQFDELMEKRSKFHQRAAALGWKLELYEQYLSEEDKVKMYIPREFRKDDYFVHDEEELSYLKESEEARFISEYKMMAKRRKFMIQEIEKIDETVKKTVEEENLPEEVAVIAVDRWFNFAAQYVKSMDIEEEKKKESTLLAHKKDEAFYRKNQVERVKNKAKVDASLTTNTRSVGVEPLAPASSTKSGEGYKLPDIELVVVDPPENSSISDNLVNMSSLEPIDETADNEGGSKNLQDQERRRKSPRISSISQNKT